MSDRLVQCRKCRHEFHEFALDDSGRCGGCVLDVQRRWDHRAEQRAAMPLDPWAAIRRARDGLLAATAWTQAPDMPDSFQRHWRPYRAALLDIIKQPDPAAVVWPELPNGDYDD